MIQSPSSPALTMMLYGRHTHRLLMRAVWPNRRTAAPTTSMLHCYKKIKQFKGHAIVIQIGKLGPFLLLQITTFYNYPAKISS